MSVSAPMDSGQPAKQRPKWLLPAGCVVLFVVVGCLCLGVFAFQSSRVNAQLEDGLAAMNSGDCSTAIARFDEVIGNTFATDETEATATSNRQVCQRYLDLVAQQEAGDLGGAAVGYADLILENSSNGLVSTVEQQARTVFTAAPSQVANAAVCGRLDSFVERNWISDLDNNLPTYYRQCGQIFSGTGDYTQAVAMYQRFVTGYPNHPAIDEVETLLAQASVAEAQQAGAGTIAPPQSIGGTGSGPAVVVIQNDSRETISLVFSGPEARFETLEPCADCIDYTIAPEFCPEQGPIGTYEIPAGTYQVVVKSISDEGVTPFVGTWDLGAGEEYYSCFFLITE